MSNYLLNLSTTDITGRNSILPRLTEVLFHSYFFLTFMSNQNVLHVETFHFIKKFNK